jgi:hypothetical protein
MGLYIAKVEVSTTDSAKILEIFKNCPHFFNGFTISGKNSVFMLLIGEDISTLQSIVECHLGSLAEVKNVEFNIIISAAKELNLPYQMKINIIDRPLCGADHNCLECKRYKEQKCLGCPVMQHYKGKVW